MRYTDPEGRVPLDTVADVGFIIYDLNSIIYNLFTGNTEEIKTDFLSLGGNMGGLFVPYVTGIGSTIRANRVVEKTEKVVNVVNKSEIPKTLYHYTSDKGLKGILETKQINPSTKAAKPQDARMGDGVYLTDIKPSKMKNGELSYQLYADGRKSSSVKNYIEVSTKGLNIIQNKDKNHIYLSPNSTPIILNKVKYGKN